MPESSSANEKDSVDWVRMSACRRNSLTKSKDEIETYWLRVTKDDPLTEKEDGRRLLLESHDAPCAVGFKVNKEIGCPLFGTEPTIENIAAVLDIAKTVAAVRKDQARDAALKRS